MSEPSLSEPPRQDANPPVNHRRLWRGIAGNVVFVLLAVPLIVGLWALAKLQLDGYWPVPDFVLSGLHHAMEENRLHLEYGDVVYLPPGRLIVRDAGLHSTQFDEILLAADAMEIRLRPGPLARGRIVLDGVSLLAGRARCPASLSPTGRTEEPLRRISMSLRRDGEGWLVERGAFALGNLRVTAEGPVPRIPKIVDALPLPAEPKPEVAWEERFSRVIRLLADADTLLDQVDHPVVHLRSFPGENGEWALEAEIRAERVRLPFAASLEEPRGEARVRLENGEWRVEKARLSGREAAAMSHGHTGVGRGAEFSARWASPLTPGAFHPREVEMRLSELELAGIRMEGVRMFARDTGADWFAFEVRAGLGGGFLQLDGEVDPFGGYAGLRAEGWLNPTAVMAHPLLEKLGFDKDVAFDEPVSLFARGRAGPGWKGAEASATATARHALIDGVAMDAASARANVDLERFTVTEMTLRHGDFETVGSYDVVYDDMSYRFLFDGTLRPAHLNPWFDDWWTLLWEDIRFAGDPLRGDIDIAGYWGDPAKIRLFGRFGAENLLVRGCGFEDVELGLFVDGFHTELFDIRAKRREGEMDGWIRFWMNPDQGDWRAFELDLRSTASVDDLAGMFGEQGRSLIAPFAFHQPPELHLRGGLMAPSAGGDYGIQLTGKSRGPIEYDRLDLEDLEVEARFEPGSTRLETMRWGLGGGDGVGSALLTNENGRDRLEFTFSLVNADLESAARTWHKYIDEWWHETEPPNSADGKLDLRMEAAGDYGDRETFHGKGGFHLKEADLADVHLLGLLSRLLRGTPLLGFTSLQFDEAVSEFQLRGDRVHFPDLRLIGPAATIRAKGDYLPADARLDFTARVHMIQQERIPVLSLILAPITAPLANVLEVKLLGTLDEPQWRFLYGPRGVMETLQTQPDG